MRRSSICLAALLATCITRPGAAQLLSARTEAFGPDLAGVYPDDWSDAVVNPALLAPGALAFGRLDWSAAESAERRFLVGGRGAGERVGLLFATSRGLEDVEAGPGMQHTLVAARYGWPDALGVRYASYSSGAAAHAPHGYALAVGARSAAGKGWSAEILAEITEMGFLGDREADYRAGELLLRQPGPERAPGHPGWDQRLLRFRGGAAHGDFLERPGSAAAPVQWAGDMRWLEAAVAQLHAFDRGAMRLAIAWDVRYTRYELEPLPCSAEDCGQAVVGSRDVLALDGGLEVRFAARVALRGGFTWAPRSRGDVPLPADWGYLAGVKPSRFGGGLWLGAGWEPGGIIAVDAAVDVRAADRSLDRTPVSLQATYRF